MGIDIATLDWIVIFGYFILILFVGFWAARKVKDTEDFFMGGRRFSVWIILAQAFGVGTHAEMPVSLAGAVYRTGYSAIWYQWKNLFITPFYWILAPIFRRVRCTTTGEVYENRYGDMMGIVYTIFALSYFIFNLGAMLKGAGKLVSAAAGGTVDPNTVVVTMTVTFLAYSFVGGLMAAAWTDLVQSFFIIALSFMLVPSGLAVVGGFTGIREKLSPEMLSMVTPGDVGVFTILMLTVNGLVGIVAQPHILAAVGSGRDENTCRIGFAYGNFIKRVCTVGWALVGLIVAAMLIQNGETLSDPEEAFGYATRHLLFPGAVGLMIASVLAANMSTCSAMMVDGGALFTQNFYRRYLVKSRTDGHYLNVGRWAGILVTMLGVLFAYFVDSVLEAFLFTETVAAFMGISMFGGISWRRANRWGALASLLIAAVIFFTLTYQQFQALLRWDAMNFGWSILAGFAALVLVSRLTPPEPPAMLEPFFEKLDTQTERDVVTDEEVPVYKEGHDLLVVHLFDDLGLSKGLGNFYRRFRVDLVGLVVAFGVVVVLIAMAVGMLYLP